MTSTLPKLLDCRGLQEEYGFTKSAALTLMEKVPKVTIEGYRKKWVKRDDVERYLEERAVA